MVKYALTLTLSLTVVERDVVGVELCRRLDEASFRWRIRNVYAQIVRDPRNLVTGAPARVSCLRRPVTDIAKR